MGTFNGIPILSLPATIGSTPSNGASLPWNGVSKSYQWTATLAITAQSMSGVNTRQKFTYNGLDVNVGMWIANLSNGLAWQIVNISAKTATSVSVTLQDIFRYNTYRDATHTGNGKPATGSYVVFELSEDGVPMIDPAPSGVGVNFLSSLTSRFQYVNNQFDFTLTQSGVPGPLATVSITLGGSSYVDGTYTNVPLTGGTGTGAQGTFVIVSGVVVTVAITNVGTGYLVGDVVSASNTNLGGTGSGFSAKVSANFAYGDVIAVSSSTNTFVRVDGANLNVIGTITAVDDTGTVFAINAIQKIVDNLNSLPGVVGDIIYSDPSNPGRLTTTAGGTEVYLQIRNQTQSTTSSNSFASNTSSITTAGNTFQLNGITIIVTGLGSLNDVIGDVNAITSITGITATLVGTGPYSVTFTASDARPINFEDTAGITTTDVGLISVENGVKAAGMYITNSRTSASFSEGIGFTFTQASPQTTWTIVHNANSVNYVAQVFDGSTGGNKIEADEITTIDVNTVQISFAAPQSGLAQLWIFVPPS